MSASDAALRDLVSAVIAGDETSWRAQLAAPPELARAALAAGATRSNEDGCFLNPIQRWMIAGDTALHFAAAAYRVLAIHPLLPPHSWTRAGLTIPIATRRCRSLC